MSNSFSELSRHDINWCVRRLPRAVRKMFEEESRQLIIAGGYVRACVANERINDIDIFASSKDAAKEAALFLCDGNEKRLVSTDNAFTVRGYGFPIQFIHRWVFDTPQSIVESFDYTIACAAIYFAVGEWRSLCDGEFYSDLAAKRLVYRSPVRNEDAGGSMLRLLKFYQRGYRCPLDSLGAVVARMCIGVDEVKASIEEDRLAKILTGLLVEVDPNADPNHLAHLPSLSEEVPKE